MKPLEANDRTNRSIDGQGGPGKAGWPDCSATQRERAPAPITGYHRAETSARTTVEIPAMSRQTERESLSEMRMGRCLNDRTNGGTWRNFRMGGRRLPENKERVK